MKNPLDFPGEKTIMLRDGRKSSDPPAAIIPSKEVLIMICNNKYLYKIELVTSADVIEFVRIATKCDYPVTLVNGSRRLNAKSVLGVAMARMAWDEIYVECDFNCYFEFEKFIR